MHSRVEVLQSLTFHEVMLKTPTVSICSKRQFKDKQLL